MSDENKPEKQAAPAAEGSAEAAKPAAAPAAAPKAVEPPPPPPPIEPGPFGQLMASKKWDLKHLGSDAVGNEMIGVTASELLAVAQFLKEDVQCRFDLLVSVSAVDWKERLESVALLYSTETHKTLVLKTDAVDEHIPSLMPVWPAADWHEREAYDLFGIQYDGHTNLRRILMPDDWLGHPMRKDYKVDDPRLVWNER